MSIETAEFAPGSAARAPRDVSFLGLEYDRLSTEEAVTLILGRNPDLPFASVVTPNAAHLSRIDRDRAHFGPPYANAWLCLNDSRVVELLARTRGLELRAAPGADVLAALFADPRFDRASSVLLVGGDEALFREFTDRARLTGASHFEAPMGLATNAAAFDATVRHIEAHPARIVLLAVGSPQQEFIAEALRRGGRATGVGLCIGAAVEFMAKRRRRAPKWMSRYGLEWMFRLVTEPRRMWRRYLVESPAVLRMYLRRVSR